MENKDYPVQNALLEKVKKGELTRDELINRGWKPINKEVEAAEA